MKIDVRPELEAKLRSIIESPEIRLLLGKYGITIDRTTNLKITESGQLSNETAVLDKDERILTLDSDFLNTATDEQLKEVLSHELSHYARSESGLEGPVGADSDPNNPSEFAVIKDDVELKRMQGYSDEQIEEYLAKRFKESPLTDDQVARLIAKPIVKDIGYDRPPHIEVGSVKDLTILSLPLGVAFHALKSGSADDYPIVKDALLDFVNKIVIGLGMIKDEVYAAHRNSLVSFMNNLNESRELLSNEEFYDFSHDQVLTVVGSISAAVMDFMQTFSYIDAKFGNITEQLKNIDGAFEVYNAEHGVVKRASIKPFVFNSRLMDTLHKTALTEDEEHRTIDSILQILNGSGSLEHAVSRAKSVISTIPEESASNIVDRVIERAGDIPLAKRPALIALVDDNETRDALIAEWVGELFQKLSNAVPSETLANYVVDVSHVITLPNDAFIGSVLDWIVRITKNGTVKLSDSFMRKVVYGAFQIDIHAAKLLIEHAIHEMERNTQRRILKCVFGENVEMPENLRHVQETPKKKEEVPTSMTPAAALKKADGIIDSSKRRPTELEPFIIVDVVHTTVYAAHLYFTMKQRYDDLEKIISSAPKPAAIYAASVLRSAWPEAEETIGKDADASLKYAIDAIKKPFPAGEKAIFEKRDVLSIYVRKFESYIPEMIARQKMSAVGCANLASTLRKTIPAVEDLVATDAAASLIYAREVVRGRWEKGEKAIATDVQIATKYVNSLHGEDRAAVVQIPEFKEAFKPIVVKTRKDFDEKLGNVLVDGKKMYNSRTRPFNHSVYVSTNQLTFYGRNNPGAVNFTWSIVADDAVKPESEGGAGFPIEMFKNTQFNEHGTSPVDESLPNIGFMYGSYTPGVGIWINEIQSDKLQHSFIYGDRKEFLDKLVTRIHKVEEELKIATDPEQKKALTETLDKLEQRKVRDGSFRFLGKEYDKYRTRFENYFSGFNLVCVNAAVNFAKNNNIPTVYWSTADRVNALWRGENIRKHFEAIYDKQLAETFGAKKTQDGQFWQLDLTPENLKKIASLARHIFNSEASINRAIRRYIPVLIETTIQEGDLRNMSISQALDWAKTVFIGDMPNDLLLDDRIYAMVEAAFAGITPQEKEQLIGRTLRQAYPNQDFDALDAQYEAGTHRAVVPGVEEAPAPRQEDPAVAMRRELEDAKNKMNDALEGNRLSEIPKIVKRIKEIEEELGIDPSARTFKGFLANVFNKISSYRRATDDEWLFSQYQEELDATIEAARRANSLFTGDWDNAKITTTSAIVECSNEHTSTHVKDFFAKLGFKVSTFDTKGVNFYIDSNESAPASKDKIVDRLITYFAEDNKRSAYYFTSIRFIRLMSTEDMITYEQWKKEQDANEKRAFLNFIADLPPKSISPGSGTVNEMDLTPEERAKDKTRMYTRQGNPEYALDLANIDEYRNGSEGKPGRDLSWMNDAIGLHKDNESKRASMPDNSKKAANEQARLVETTAVMVPSAGILFLSEAIANRPAVIDGTNMNMTVLELLSTSFDKFAIDTEHVNARLGDAYVEGYALESILPQYLGGIVRALSEIGIKTMQTDELVLLEGSYDTTKDVPVMDAKRVKLERDKLLDRYNEMRESGKFTNSPELEGIRRRLNELQAKLRAFMKFAKMDVLLDDMYQHNVNPSDSDPSMSYPHEMNSRRPRAEDSDFMAFLNQLKDDKEYYKEPKTRIDPEHDQPPK